MPTHYRREEVCFSRLYTILYSRPQNQIFCSKDSDIKTQMTIQQLLLTLSKAISVLILKVIQLKYKSIEGLEGN